MAVYINPLAIKAELDYVKNACNQIVIVSAYDTTHNRATVIGNMLASIDLAASPAADKFIAADFTTTQVGNNYQLTFASGRSDTSANATGNANHVVFLDSTNVLLATTVTQQGITINNQVNFPSITFTANQPV
jgi:hypothetical protein